MKVTIIWSNPTRNLIARQEFGKGMSYKNKLGCKPSILNRHIEVNLPDKVNMGWKRELQYAINKQFQQDRKATIFFTGAKKGSSHFVCSARSAKQFSNEVANGVLRMRGDYANKNHIDNITVKSLLGT